MWLNASKLLVLGLVLGLLFFHVRAQEQPDSRHYEAIFDELEVKLEAEGLEQQTEVVDKMSLELEALEGPVEPFTTSIAAIDLSYQSVTNNTEQEIDFEVVLVKIVEFQTNGDPNAQFTENSIIVSEYDTTSAPRWPKAGWQPTTRDQNGLTVDGFTITTTDGILTLNGWYSGDPAFQYGPHSVKIDIEIRNYPFSQPNGTRLGLLAFIESEVEIENDDNDNDNDNDQDADNGSDNDLDADSNEPDLAAALEDDGDDDGDDDKEAGALNMVPTFGATFGQFAWAGKAQSDNVTHNVIANVVSVPAEEGAANLLYFTFMTPSGGDVIWDPSVGVQYKPPNDAKMLTIIILGTLLGIVVVVAASWLTYYVLKGRKMRYESLDSIEES